MNLYRASMKTWLTDLLTVIILIEQVDCPRIYGYLRCGLSTDIRKDSVADVVQLQIVSCGWGADADPVV